MIKDYHFYLTKFAKLDLKKNVIENKNFELSMKDCVQRLLLNLISKDNY